MCIRDREKEDISFKQFDPESGSYVTSDFFSNTTHFKRDIHAVYSTYSNKIGGIEFMAGLRGELTNREIKSAKNDSSITLNRFDLFPTLHLSYDLGDKNQLMASYSRRINRPNGGDLDPVPAYYNRYTVRIGNPGLEPAYTLSLIHISEPTRPY